MDDVEYSRYLSKLLWRAAAQIRKLKGNYRPPGALSNQEWARGLAKVADECARDAERTAHNTRA